MVKMFCVYYSERDYLSQRLNEMEKVMALARAEIEKLRQENQNLKEEKEKLGYPLQANALVRFSSLK